MSKNRRNQLYLVVILAAVAAMLFIVRRSLPYSAFEDNLKNQVAVDNRINKGSPNLETGFILISEPDNAKLSQAIQDESGLTEDTSVSTELQKIHVKRYKVNTDLSTTQEVAARIDAKLKHLDAKGSVEVDAQLPEMLVPNDPWYSTWQTYYAAIGAPAAWDKTTGNSSVIVAVIDSGVNTAHPDLQGQLVAGWNFLNNNSDVTDKNGHGTLVAGSVTALSNNGIGVASTCWHCKVMPLKVDDNGSVYDSTLASALTYAADHGARVANMSFLYNYNSTLESAAQYMDNKGGLVTMSVGNLSTLVNLPTDPNIMVIGATDGCSSSYNTLANYSSYGPIVDMVAPGTVYSTTNAGGYSSVAGTSFSTPMVAAAGALALSINPSLTSAQLRAMLTQTADDYGPAGRDNWYGAGVLDLNRLVAAASGQTIPQSQPNWGKPCINSYSINPTTTPWKGTITLTPYVSTANTLASVSLALNGTIIATLPGNNVSAGNFNIPINTANYPDGTTSLTVTATDSLGNAGVLKISGTILNGSGTVTSDTTVPTTPTNLVAVAQNSTSAGLNWAASTDNVGVAGYQIWRDGILVGTSTTTSFIDSSLAANTTYSYAVKAYDASGNISAASNLASITTPSIALSFVSGPAVSSKTATSATTVGSTSLATTWIIQYGVSRSNLSSSVSDSSSATAHSIGITGLAKGTTYYYQVAAKAADGSTITSQISSFKTARK